MIMGKKSKPPSMQNGASVPATCAVCARKCHALAYCPDTHGRKDWMWICDDPTCIKSAKVVYMSKTKELERYEKLAIDKAAEKTDYDFFAALFMAAYNAGANSIADIDGDMVNKILHEATKEGELQKVHRQFLIEYSEAMRDIVENEIPF